MKVQNKKKLLLPGIVLVVFLAFLGVAGFLVGRGPWFLVLMGLILVLDSFVLMKIDYFENEEMTRNAETHSAAGSNIHNTPLRGRRANFC
jgi:predicted tellurium resistance membrane protein TerC